MTMSTTVCVVNRTLSLFGFRELWVTEYAFTAGISCHGSHFGGSQSWADIDRDDPAGGGVGRPDGVDRVRRRPAQRRAAAFPCQPIGSRKLRWSEDRDWAMANDNYKQLWLIEIPIE